MSAANSCRWPWSWSGGWKATVLSEEVPVFVLPQARLTSICHTQRRKSSPVKGLSVPGPLPDLSLYFSAQMVVVMDPEDDGKPKIPQARRTADFVPPARERRYVFDKAFDAHLDNRALYTSTVKVCQCCRCCGPVLACCNGQWSCQSAVGRSTCSTYMCKEVMRQQRC